MIESTLSKLEEKKNTIIEEYERIYTKFSEDRYNNDLQTEFEKKTKEKMNINEEIAILKMALEICKKYK